MKLIKDIFLKINNRLINNFISFFMFISIIFKLWYIILILYEIKFHIMYNKNMYYYAIVFYYY